ncbi:citrate synthase [Variovorax defluvii]|uniref:citrate synthase (unknown stereospecificity) n=1 Tax=Variovorax defluvii TaxID=913761 RepID=A0ABP8ICB6_9BURK
MNTTARTASPKEPPSDYLSAKEAARMLGVKIPSLYSYVSRGVIRSVMQPGTRARLYYREDVESAGKRMGGRAGIPDTVETAVRWGQPMLASSVTELTDGGPRYRGRDAIEMARRGRSFESVSELLWSGLDFPALPCWSHPEPPSEVFRRVEVACKDAGGLTSGRLMVLTNVMVALSMPEKPDFERGTTMADAASLICLYASAMGLLGPAKRIVRPVSGRPVAELLAAALLPGKSSEEAVQAINAALVVCADHELSPSTLAARVAASTGAELRACLHAAIATHSGIRLGGGCDRAEQLLAAARNPEDLRRSIGTLESAGRQVPGFNLIAYPKGDPRARFLLELASQLPGAAKTSYGRLEPLLKEAETSFDLKPSIEVGLIGLAMALKLPPRGASALWTIGRCAGWTAHVVEQRLAGFMLRPRAKYVPPA